MRALRVAARDRATSSTESKATRHRTPRCDLGPCAGDGAFRRGSTSRLRSVGALRAPMPFRPTTPALAPPRPFADRFSHNARDVGTAVGGGGEGGRSETEREMEVCGRSCRGATPPRRRQRAAYRTEPPLSGVCGAPLVRSNPLTFGRGCLFRSRHLLLGARGAAGGRVQGREPPRSRRTRRRLQGGAVVARCWWSPERARSPVGPVLVCFRPSAHAGAARCGRPSDHSARTIHQARQSAS